MPRPGSADDEQTTPDTPLRRQLNEGSPPAKATPLDALDLAVEWFEHGRKLDLQGLARELGVTRVTMHRWVGTREELLTEVLWHSAQRHIGLAEAEVDDVTDDPAANRTALVLSTWMGRVLLHPGVQQLQRDENDTFVRLMTRDASEMQRRLIERVRTMLAADLDAGRLHLDIELDDLAYTVVRIAEAYVHSRTITGEAPDTERASRVLRALLR